MSIPVSIWWQYTFDHRFNSDLDKRVDEMIKSVIEGNPEIEDDGDGGGTSFDTEEFNCDQTRYLIVPNMEVAETLRVHIDAIIKGYDERYEAVLERNDEGGDEDD